MSGGACSEHSGDRGAAAGDSAGRASRVAACAGAAGAAAGRAKAQPHTRAAGTARPFDHRHIVLIFQ